MVVSGVAGAVGFLQAVLGVSGELQRTPGYDARSSATSTSSAWRYRDAGNRAAGGDGENGRGCPSPPV